MSTILDALRKVAEDQRTHVDVRTRLLSFPPRLDTRARRRSGMVSFIGAGVAIIGFAAGAGLMYWRSRLPVPEESPAPAAFARSTVDAPATAARTAPVVPSTPPSTIAEPQPPPSAPEVSHSTPPTAPPVPSAPEVSHSTPPTAPPVPSASAAPVLPPDLLAMKERLLALKDQLSSAPMPTPLPRTVVPRPEVPPSTKEAKRPVPPPASTPLRQPPPVPAVRPELAMDNPPVAPFVPFSSVLPDAPDPGAQIEDPTAEILPFPQVPSGVPPTETLLPTQLPPVVEGANTGPSDVSLSFLQWSPEADKRMAFLRVRGGPLTMAQEGDAVGSFTVAEIGPETVTLRSGDKTWVLQVR